MWLSAGFFWDLLRDLGHACFYLVHAAELYFCLICSNFVTRASKWLCMRNALMKKEMLFCQWSHINKEVNNGLGYLLQLWDGALFFSGCSRLFSILLRADSLLIAWKWPPECWCVCSSLSCTDKLVIIFTLNGDLSVLPHLYYSLIVDDTTSAHLAENKTYNHDNNAFSSPGNMVFCQGYQTGEQPIIQNVHLILLHEWPNVLSCFSQRRPG